MPTIMTHAVVAWGLGRVLTRFRRLPAHLWLLAAGLAMFPDLDVLAGPLGIPETLASEAAWVWLPLAILVTAAWLVRPYRTP